VSGAYQAGSFTVEAVSLPPVITTQPGSLTINAGATGALSVVANSTDPLSYQWRKGGIAISGATAASLALNGVSEFSAGTYDVLVTNAAGSVTSAQAILQVVLPVVILSQPAPLSSPLGASGSLSVTVTGTPPFTYKWKKNGVTLPLATGATLFFNSVAAGDFGAYTVEVSNAAGRAISATTGLSLTSKVAIAAQPASVRTRAGAAATFSVVATGTEPLSYQWKKNGFPIQGAIRSSYTVPFANDLEIAGYEVFVYNAFGDVTSETAHLNIAGEKGISFLSTPGQPETGTLTLVKGTAGGVPLAVDSVDAQAARTTYQLLRFSGAGAPQLMGPSGLIPSGGTLSVPLRSFVESGTYAIEYIRQYADGSPAVKVLSEPFDVDVLSFEAAAGVYELLLEDSNQAIQDGATYRGALLVTVTKSGAVSGKLLYNEAPKLYGEDDPARRVYTPVTRSFTGVFSTSQTETEKLVCSPKLGVGTQAGRQQLALELDFTTSPASLSASVVDRASVPLETAEEGARSAAPAVTRNLTKLVGTNEAQTADLSTAVARYNVGSSHHVTNTEGPGLSPRAFLLAQVLVSGRVLWASRLEGQAGTGSAGLRFNEAGALVAPFYEGRLKSSAKLHQSNSLLAALQWESLADGLWEMRTGVGLAAGSVERQSSHVTKNNGRAEYSDSFEAVGLETKDFNWSCVAQLDLSAGNFCVWNGSMKAGLFQHFSLTQASALESTPRILTLALEDPAEGTPYLWKVSLSITGAIRVTPLGAGLPNLTLRFDRVRGEFTGSYVSSFDKIRRTIVGAAILDPTEDLLRAHGWVELNALPATKSAAWKLELLQPN
jgi:Immunoglobulin I-set domain